MSGANWVTIIGANHGGIKEPPRLEIEEDLVLATKLKNSRWEWLPFYLKSR
jgi:hypothetical protein